MGISQINTEDFAGGNDLQVWQPPSLPCRLPGQFERYELIERLGKPGGMGSVYLAIDHSMRSNGQPGESLAIKFLHLSGDQRVRESMLDKLIEEVRMGRRIRHANIVGATDFIRLDQSETNGQRWPDAGFVLDLCAMSLEEVLDGLDPSNPTMTSDQVVKLCRHLCEALICLQSSRIVHRDIKPSNILFVFPDGQTYDGPESLNDATLKLSDLGVAVPEGSVPWLLLRQDGYKAPELWDARTGALKLNVAAHASQDIWAVGKVLEKILPLVQGQPTYIREAITQCLNPEPTRRPSAGELSLILSPDRELQQKILKRAGWEPEEHKGFIGRDFVFKAFDEFRQQCQQQGGLFLLEADAGIGKSALLTEWVRRQGATTPAFFFRHSQGRTSPFDMPRALHAQLCERYKLEAKLSDREEMWGRDLAELLKQIANDERHRPTVERPLLVIVDAIDECYNPQEAVQLLPHEGLPPNVIVIASSRPPKGENDYLASLKRGHTRHFPLRGDDENNIKDITDYLERELSVMFSRANAEHLARSLGGIFQLIVFVAEAIQEERMTAVQALADAEQVALKPVGLKTHEWYQIQWDRIVNKLEPTTIGLLVDLLGLLAAAQAPMGESLQVLPILRWRGFQLDLALKHVKWLLRADEKEQRGHKDTFLQLRHQSVRDYLVSRDPPGPLRNDIESMHRRIADYYLDKATKGWGRVEPYGRYYTPRHAILSADREHIEMAAELLSDLVFIQATIGELPAALRDG